MFGGADWSNCRRRGASAKYGHCRGTHGDADSPTHCLVLCAAGGHAYATTDRLKGRLQDGARERVLRQGLRRHAPAGVHGRLRHRQRELAPALPAVQRSGLHLAQALQCWRLLHRSRRRLRGFPGQAGGQGWGPRCRHHHLRHGGDQRCLREGQHLRREHLHAWKLRRSYRGVRRTLQLGALRRHLRPGTAADVGGPALQHSRLHDPRQGLEGEHVCGVLRSDR
mmetsp:Transcript_126117/g.403574  ORF Transcript_126117/g.403574 Transcript_126117/m.403574 type:complete len:224 (-) Transcript_126117:677-1348(-)